MSNLFFKNLNALKNENLKNELKELKINRVKAIVGKDNLDINFAMGGGGIYFFQIP